MVLWLSTRNCWIRVPHSSRLNQLSLMPNGRLRSHCRSWLKPSTTCVPSSPACPAIELMIKVSTPLIRAMPPSRVTAEEGPRPSPQRCSRLATGLSIAASRMATATGMTTSDRKPRIQPTK